MHHKDGSQVATISCQLCTYLVKMGPPYVHFSRRDGNKVRLSIGNGARAAMRTRCAGSCSYRLKSTHRDPKHTLLQECCGAHAFSWRGSRGAGAHPEVIESSATTKYIHQNGCSTTRGVLWKLFMQPRVWQTKLQVLKQIRLQLLLLCSAFMYLFAESALASAPNSDRRCSRTSRLFGNSFCMTENRHAVMKSFALCINASLMCRKGGVVLHGSQGP
jgi:hypothetical protein